MVFLERDVESKLCLGASDPDEIDEPITNSNEFHRIKNVFKDDFQWQDCVTADNLNMSRMLQAEVAEATTPN